MNHKNNSIHNSIHPPVKLGVEVLFEKRLDLIRGKHVGLITNPTGLDSKLDSIIERFRACPDTKLVALYGPEHGVRGNAQAATPTSHSAEPIDWVQVKYRHKKNSASNWQACGATYSVATGCCGAVTGRAPIMNPTQTPLRCAPR